MGRARQGILGVGLRHLLPAAVIGLVIGVLAGCGEKPPLNPDRQPTPEGGQDRPTTNDRDQRPTTDDRDQRLTTDDRDQRPTTHDRDQRPLPTTNDQRPFALDVTGDHFTVDGSPTFLTFISYFDGTRRAAAGGVDADFAYLEGKVHGVRVLPNWWADPCALRSGTDTLIDLDGGIRSEAWRQLQAVLDSAARHRLVVDLSLTRETVTDNATPPRVLAVDAYAGAIARLVGSTAYLKDRYPHVLIDVQNEWPRFTEAPDIEALLLRLRAADPQRILAASSSGGPYQAVGLSVSKMAAAYHDPRERDWFTAAAAGRVVEGVKAALAGTAQPVYLQEPSPSSAQCPGQQHDADGSHFVEAMTQARTAGAAAWTFHTRLGFALREQTLVQRLQEPANATQKTVIEQLMK